MWWMIYSPKQQSAKTQGDSIFQLPEGMWNLTSVPEYISTSNCDIVYEFDDDHFLDVVQADIIMDKLDPYEKRAVVSDAYCYCKMHDANVSAQKIRKKARKLAQISSPRLFADKLRSGLAIINDVLRQKKMIRSDYYGES
jgi:hypothetical protein